MGFTKRPASTTVKVSVEHLNELKAQLLVSNMYQFQTGPWRMKVQKELKLPALMIKDKLQRYLLEQW
jgi:hypothetical protein